MKWNAELRKASEVQNFPYLQNTVTFIKVCSDGNIKQGKTKREKKELVFSSEDNDILLACWPGQWSQDIFEIDNFSEVFKAFM